MRALLAAVCAIWFRLITRGRVRGSSFILRSPSALRVAAGNTITIGRNVMIDKDARIVALGGDIAIEDDVFIGKNSTIIAFSNLRIGARTLLGQNCSLHTENHGPAGRRSNYSSAAITIGEDAWLGAGVVVTSGVTIGRAVTVGANSVVTKDLAPDGIYAGAPARLIRSAL